MDLKEFEKLGKLILKHKYLYHIRCEPVISDSEFDDLERKYVEMAEKIDMEPKVHIMEDWDQKLAGCVFEFPDTHPWALKIIDKFEEEQ